MKNFVFVIFFVCSLAASAQDVHFTMYPTQPIIINPAATGVFSGDVRGVLNYRSQWASIGNPYKTYSFLIDGGILKNKWRKGYLGIGASAYRDVAGETQFGTTKVGLSLSSVLYLDNNNAAAVGLMGSWAQTGINQDNLRWDAQFAPNGYNAALPSNESMAFNNASFFDFTAGVLWSYGSYAKTLSSNDDINIQIGAAFYHITRPSADIANLNNLDKLYSKASIHGKMHYGFENSKWAVRPSALVFLQGPTRQVNIGMMFRYMLREESKYTGIFKESALSLGGYYRFGDAFAPSIQFEIASLAIGVSYDLNMSGLKTATNGQGGPEVFLRFINPNPFSYGRGSKSNARFN